LSSRISRKAVPSSRLNSIPCKEEDVLAVGSAMLAGELEYRNPSKCAERKPAGVMDGGCSYTIFIMIGGKLELKIHRRDVCCRKARTDH
jgi:hypothetical protein